MDESTADTGTSSAAGLRVSRRTLIRTAAQAAWMVPAIQVVSAAPAFANGSDILVFTNQGSGAWSAGTLRTSMTASGIVVQNNSTTDATQDLQVTVTFPNRYVRSVFGFNINITIDQVTTGWSAGPPSYSGSGTGRTGSVTFTASSQLPVGGSSPALGFRVNLSTGVLVDGNTADTVTLTATANDADGGPGFTPAAGSFNPTP